MDASTRPLEHDAEAAMCTYLPASAADSGSRFRTWCHASFTCGGMCTEIQTRQNKLPKARHPKPGAPQLQLFKLSIALDFRLPGPKPRKPSGPGGGFGVLESTVISRPLGFVNQN